MKTLARIAASFVFGGLLAGCVYQPAPVAYAPAPAYYGSPVVVGVYGGGWHYGWHR